MRPIFAIFNFLRGLKTTKFHEVPSGTAVKMYGKDADDNLVEDDVPSGGGATAFTELSDVPQSYTDQAGKMLVVNENENALEYADVPSGGDNYKIGHIKPLNVPNINFYNNSRPCLIDIDENRIAYIWYCLTSESPFGEDVKLNFYNVNTDVWSEPITICSLSVDSQIYSFKYGNYIYFVCGTNYKKFNILTNEITDFTSNSTIIAGAYNELINGLFYCIVTDGYSFTMFTYNPATDSWVSLATKTIDYDFTGIGNISFIKIDNDLFFRPDPYDNFTFHYRYNIINDEYYVTYVIRDIIESVKYSTSYYNNISIDYSTDDLYQIRYNDDYNLIYPEFITHILGHYPGDIFYSLYKDNCLYFGQSNIVYSTDNQGDTMITIYVIKNIDLDALLENLSE